LGLFDCSLRMGPLGNVVPHEADKHRERGRLATRRTEPVHPRSRSALDRIADSRNVVHLLSDSSCFAVLLVALQERVLGIVLGHELVDVGRSLEGRRLQPNVEPRFSVPAWQVSQGHRLRHRSRSSLLPAQSLNTLGRTWGLRLGFQERTWSWYTCGENDEKERVMR